MLKPREYQILRLLADGFGYKEIAQKLGIHPSCLHVHCHHIRQQTGIESTKSSRHCREWLDAHPGGRPNGVTAIPPIRPPTPKQLRALELYAVHCKNMDQIAWEMGVTVQSAQNYVFLGIARARIRPRDYTGDRRKEIRAYLAQQNPVTMDDPMFQ